MSATTDAATAVILNVSGKTLSGATLLNVATLYAESYGGQWANPWDVDANPAENAAWPTNDEIAQFLLDKVRSHMQVRVYRAKKKSTSEGNEAAENAAAQAEADKL